MVVIVQMGTKSKEPPFLGTFRTRELLAKEEGPGGNSLCPSESLPQAFSVPFAIHKKARGGGSFYAGMRVVYSDSDNNLYATELIMNIDRSQARTERRRTYEYQAGG